MYLYTFKVCIVSWSSFVKGLYVDAGLRFALGATLAPRTTTPSMPEWVLPPQACYRARAVYVARLATFSRVPRGGTVHLLIGVGLMVNSVLGGATLRHGGFAPPGTSVSSHIVTSRG